MNLIRTASLVRRQKESIVHCEIALCLAPGASDRYLVNLRQVGMGEEWRETTRTPHPVALADVETLFHLDVTERMAQGFVAPADLASLSIPAVPAPTMTLPAPAPTDAYHILLQRLEPGSWRKRTQPSGTRAMPTTSRFPATSARASRRPSCCGACGRSSSTKASRRIRTSST